MNFFGKKENIFLVIAIIFGILWLIIIPPFQTPDEDAHFYRSYGISEGSLMCINANNSNAGSYLPLNIVEFIKTIKADSIRFNYLAKQDIHDVIRSSELYPSDEKVLVEYVNSCVYSPVPYISQTMGILAGKLFDAPFIIMFYLGRLLNFMTFILIGYCSIKSLPKLKGLLLLLLVMPMTLQQSISLSPDVITISICVYFVCYILKIKYQNDKTITKKNIGVLFFLACTIGLLKITYFPLAILTLLIPLGMYKSKKHWIYTNSIVFFGSLLMAVIWLALTRTVTMTFPVDPIVQLRGISDNPLSFIKLMLLSTPNNDDLFMQFFGVFGWLDTPSPLLLGIAYYVMLFLIVFYEGRKNSYERNKYTFLSAVISLLPVLLCTLLIQISLFLNWPQTTPGTVSGVQGRYFIPISLSFFYSIYLMVPFLIKIKRSLLIFIICLILLISSYRIIVRYYHFGPDYEILEVYNNTYIPGGIQHDTEIRQSFLSVKDNLKGVRVFLSTFGQEITTPYQFVLFSENGKVIREVTLSMDGFGDNHFYDVFFNEIEGSKDQKYSFKIMPMVTEVETPITIQISEPDIYLEGEFTLNGNVRTDDIVFRLIY
ncbi:DUF2142 domain-containing protein [Paenibacillus anaericanus]|uniref:DUF2142 domain-containing protein n=1 Tax=Paenibacillus anaericanus TaxID=170367 RepID=A0A3S1BJB6_9BACL|nr:DUF2142 domain-containing protein [Paenibacillus anaericanus]RUT42877.1 DUF2142 domain-containing protein [Paenibacillus anaericanus]